LSNPDNEDARRALLREAPTASQFGLQMDVIHVRGRDEIPAAVASAKHISADALLIMGDSMLNTPPNTIPDLVGELALPAIYQNRQAVEAGGLIAYVPDLSAIARRHAHFVDRVLRGASPADLPVEQPTKYDLIINLKTAKTLKLTIPSSLLARADEVLD
jgi:putative ABC transport system substrate-binding protein